MASFAAPPDLASGPGGEFYRLLVAVLLPIPLLDKVWISSGKIPICGRLLASAVRSAHSSSATVDYSSPLSVLAHSHHTFLPDPDVTD